MTEETVTPTQVPEDFDLFDFNKAKTRLAKLVTSFGCVVTEAQNSRELRYKDLNTQTLRDKGTIDKDAFLVPVRVVDSNIRREQPAFVNYIKQSKRILIFKSVDNPEYITDRLEEEFTTGMTYIGWEKPFIKVIDGSQTHGRDYVEVVYDPDKPFKVSIEHVGKDRLVLPPDAEDIQACEVILRAFTLSKTQLKDLVTYKGFNKEEVDKITDKNPDSDELVTVYKKFCKYNGQVYVSWCELTCTGDWLRAPRPLFLGIKEQVPVTSVQDVPVTTVDPLTGYPVTTMVPQQVETLVWKDSPVVDYPIFMLPYFETEQKSIASHKGRAYLDKNKQEAATANLSAFLTGCHRASQPRFSPETNENSNSKLQSIDLSAGNILPIPLKQLVIAWPDSTMLALQQYMDIYNSQEVGQIATAVNNRKDSRKTATEIQAATVEGAKLNSVQVVNLSIFVLEVFGFVWTIVQSLALQDKIRLLYDAIQGHNKYDELQQTFHLTAAGDIDVIKRLELLAQLKEFWPVVMNTPIALPYLALMMRLALPTVGEGFAKQLEQGDPRVLLAALVEILRSTITQEELAALPPDRQQVLFTLLQQAEAITAPLKQATGLDNVNTNQASANSGEQSSSSNGTGSRTGAELGQALPA